MDAHLSLLDDVPLLWTNPHMKEHPLPPAQKNDFARRGKARPENNRICRRMETDIDVMHFRQNRLVRIMTGETALQENKEQEYSCR